jgi:pyruvate,orthophosphate dikinase
MGPAAARPDSGAPETEQRRVFHFGKGRSDGNKAMKDLVCSRVR